MALKATIFKAELQVSDLDRGYYDTHALTLARHPSETDERMMVRMLAYALHADPALAFAGDVATDDEPGLWRRDLTGAIEQWIEVGLPEPRVLRRAAGRAARCTCSPTGAVQISGGRALAPNSPRCPRSPSGASRLQPPRRSRRWRSARCGCSAWCRTATSPSPTRVAR